ncbi:MAG: asparagine synthase (glutamine-hydrolyzing) [Acidobacteriota bacterium]|nr:asparagine synthase (glutamine-hydrolyzing) [Acidobacteriota bacterium]
MCGIVGVFNLDGGPVDVPLLVRATRVQRHRGPDDEGYLLANTFDGSVVSCGGEETDPRLSLPDAEQFCDKNFNLAFGFRRLSIQDLSPAGHQPMSSADGRHWIVFNGEIYNYVELRSELSGYGHQFRTGTDTEIILAAYRQWGVDCLQRFNGMWAFAVWDSAARNLFVARDRFGEKPFHYVYVPGKVFAFASEIKSLWAAGVIERRIHEQTLEYYKCYEEVDVDEQTFYESVWRLPQAHYLLLDGDGRFEKRRYWDIDLRDQEEGRPDEWYSERFRRLFFESVEIRLRSDVPVGSSLSGGLDSSTVVTVMDRLLPRGTIQKTFSARFDDPAKDEGKWIEHVTAATRVEPHVVWPTGEKMFEEIGDVFWHQDEPFGSASIYAQWCVMRLAREHEVTVLLDGQGADEMLAGYHHFFGVVADDLLRGLNVPAYLKWTKSYRNLHGRPMAGVLGFGGLIKQSVPGSIKKPVKALLGRRTDGPPVKPFLPTYPREFSNVSALRKMLWWHTTRKGLAELLRYADRNSMAHSREVRLPFLDHHLVEFVFKLPDRLLLRDGWTKWILRSAFRGIVPDAIGFRVDKLGYEPPQQRWLDGVEWRDVMLGHLLRGDRSLAEGGYDAVNGNPGRVVSVG